MQRENVTSSEKYESSFLSKERYEFLRRNIRNKNSKVSKLSTALKRKLATSKSMGRRLSARESVTPSETVSLDGIRERVRSLLDALSRS